MYKIESRSGDDAEFCLQERTRLFERWKYKRASHPGRPGQLALFK